MKKIKKIIGPRGIDGFKVSRVCPYNGWRGEYRTGYVEVLCNFKGNNEIGLIVSQDSERHPDEVDDEDVGIDGIVWDRCADVVLDVNDAERVIKALLKAIKEHDSAAR